MQRILPKVEQSFLKLSLLPADNRFEFDLGLADSRHPKQLQVVSER